WILPLDDFGYEVEAFLPAAIEANRWIGELYALPWFIDVGMLYWRTDLLDRAPETLEELVSGTRNAVISGDARLGHVWQGARYEGLVTTFVEILGAFGGTIMGPDGRVAVASPAAVR